MLQALNLLEDIDLKSMGYNSARYIHTLYQVMNLAFADRDFYYGDPRVPPVEPIKGLLSKEYASAAAQPDQHRTERPHGSSRATPIPSRVIKTPTWSCWKNGPRSRPKRQRKAPPDSSKPS